MNFSLMEMKGEKWADIVPFNGDYKISNYGRVWALPRMIISSSGQTYFTKERIRKQSLNTRTNSYTGEDREQLGVNLRYEGKTYHFLVNRLVYHYFIAPINFKEDLFRVVHKNGDNCENKSDNLVLMNGSQLYAHDLLHNHKPRTSKLIKKAGHKEMSIANAPKGIVKYTLEGKIVNKYESLTQAATDNNVARSSLRDVAKKRLKQWCGFVYRYQGDRYRGEYAGVSQEKPVTQYRIDGKRIAGHESVTKAAQATGIDANVISRCALNKCRLGNGYVWRYQGEKYGGEYRNKIKNLPLPLWQYTVHGKKVQRFSSTNAASIATGFSAATLLDCAYKRTKISHGYVWRFEGEVYKGEYRNYRRSKPITQHSLEGKKISTYSSIEEAAKATGLTADNIQKNVSGANKTAGGFIWKEATAKEIAKLPRILPEEFHPHPIRKTSVKKKGHTVTQYSLDGKKINTFSSIWQAGKATGVSSSAISSAVRNKLLTTGGFIWKAGKGLPKINIKKHFVSRDQLLKRTSKPVVKYSLDGEYITSYPSIAAAARAEEVTAKRISSAINNKTMSAVGCVWRLGQ